MAGLAYTSPDGAAASKTGDEGEEGFDAEGVFAGAFSSFLGFTFISKLFHKINFSSIPNIPQTKNPTNVKAS